MFHFETKKDLKTSLLRQFFTLTTHKMYRNQLHSVFMLQHFAKFNNHLNFQLESFCTFKRKTFGHLMTQSKNNLQIFNASL